MKRIRTFGHTSDGKEVLFVLLTNGRGTELALLSIGATIHGFRIRDARGEFIDVVPGFSTVQFMEKNEVLPGAVVGRYANRIRGARFSLNGQEYRLTPWGGPDMPSLHSFPDSYAFRVFELRETEEENEVCFFLKSGDGDQGFPGNLEFSVTYTLTEDDGIRIKYEAVSDADTLFNPTNHVFFNLDGHDSGSVLEHRLRIDATKIPVYDGKLCPTGAFLEAAGTPFDFRTGKRIGEDIFRDVPALRDNLGYDLAYAVNGGRKAKEPHPVALLTSARSGLSMEVLTDMPALQLYTGNYLDIDDGKDGAVYKRHAAVALETGFFANGIRTDLPEKAILRKGEKFSSETEYRFRTEE